MAKTTTTLNWWTWKHWRHPGPQHCSRQRQAWEWANESWGIIWHFTRLNHRLSSEWLSKRSFYPYAGLLVQFLLTSGSSGPGLILQKVTAPGVGLHAFGLSYFLMSLIIHANMFLYPLITSGILSLSKPTFFLFFAFRKKKSHVSQSWTPAATHHHAWTQLSSIHSAGFPQAKCLPCCMPRRLFLLSCWPEGGRTAAPNFYLH